MVILTVTVMWMDQTHGLSKGILAEVTFLIPVLFVRWDRGAIRLDVNVYISVNFIFQIAKYKKEKCS
jgi:hypothetical protein